MAVCTRLRRRLGSAFVPVLGLLVLLAVAAMLYSSDRGLANSEGKREVDLDDWEHRIPSTHEAYVPPLRLTLDLPSKYTDNHILKDMKKCVRQYGFNLDLRCGATHAALLCLLLFFVEPKQPALASPQDAT